MKFQGDLKVEILGMLEGPVQALPYWYTNLGKLGRPWEQSDEALHY